jgi:hypothetical protein
MPSTASGVTSSALCTPRPFPIIITPEECLMQAEPDTVFGGEGRHVSAAGVAVARSTTDSATGSVFDGTRPDDF